MNTTNPREAWDVYNDAQRLAEDNYEEFWRQAFLSGGLAFQKKDYENVADAGDWEFIFYIYPRRYEGVKVHYRNPTSNPHSWRIVKIRSKSGLEKFFRTLHTLTQ